MFARKFKKFTLLAVFDTILLVCIFKEKGKITFGGSKFKNCNVNLKWHCHKVKKFLKFYIIARY